MALSLSAFPGRIGGQGSLRLGDYYADLPYGRGLPGVPVFGNPISISQFAPILSLPVPVLRFDARLLFIGQELGDVAEWPNAGSLGGAATGAGDRPPQLVEDAGDWKVTFDRVSSAHLDLGQLSWPWLAPGGGGMTVAIVGRYAGDPVGWERWMDCGNGTASDNIWLGRGGASSDLTFEAFYAGEGSAGYSFLPIDAFTTDWHVWVVRLSPGAGTVSWYADWPEPVATQEGYTFQDLGDRTTTTNYIGRSNWNDPYLHADLREFRIYDVALDDAQMTVMMDELMTRWGVAAVPPP